VLAGACLGHWAQLPGLQVLRLWLHLEEGHTPVGLQGQPLHRQTLVVRTLRKRWSFWRMEPPPELLPAGRGRTAGGGEGVQGGTPCVVLSEVRRSCRGLQPRCAAAVVAGALGSCWVRE
jgi:hypothetical protein